MRDPRHPKSAQRCAIVTPLQEHESGTFGQCRTGATLSRAP
jgi:hypothetical protein